MQDQICPKRLKQRLDRQIGETGYAKLARAIRKNKTTIRRLFKKMEEPIKLFRISHSETKSLEPVMKLLGYSTEEELIQGLIPSHKLHPHIKLQNQLVEFASLSEGLRQLPMTHGYLQSDFWKSVERDVRSPVNYIYFKPNEPIDWNGEGQLCVIRGIDTRLIEEVGKRQNLDGKDNSNSAKVDVPWLVDLQVDIIKHCQTRPVVLDLKIDVMSFGNLVVNAGSFGELLSFGSPLSSHFDRWAKDRIKDAREKTSHTLEEEEIRELAGRHPQSWDLAIGIFSETPSKKERIENFLSEAPNAMEAYRTLPHHLAQLLLDLKSDQEKSKDNCMDLVKYKMLIAAGILWIDGKDVKSVVPHWQDDWHSHRQNKS